MPTRQYLPYYLILIVMLLISVSGSAQTSDWNKYGMPEVWVAATDYPPYVFAQADGTPAGFDLEVARQAFKRAGYRMRFAFYPWARVINGLKTGRITAALTCIQLPERKSFVAVSVPVSTMRDIFLVRQDYQGPKLSSLTDLKESPLKVGTVRGYADVKFLAEKGISFDISSNETIALKKLATGRIDVFPNTLESSRYFVQKLDMKGKFKWFRRENVHTDKFCLCFSKKWPGYEKILEKFNQAIERMKADESLEAIHDRYR